MSPSQVVTLSALKTAALAFAYGLWITDHKIPTLAGAVRSFYSTLVIMTCAYGLGQLELLDAHLSWPSTPALWLYVLLLSAFYCLPFIILFTFAPRFDMAPYALALPV